ncbi:hypothetical protein [Xanthomonas phage SB4]|uniref:dATP/dGTP diphosphohydrolase N-terminal domain-containing protein n=1 Tax=Xanthomonas phage SB4 TaxID=3117473 RepID=A0ABZ2GUM9_9CAUD
MKALAYRVIAVTPTDVENGATKDSIVYIHSQVPNSDMCFFVTHPDSEEGFPLTEAQVMRAPDHDLEYITPQPETTPDPIESVPRIEEVDTRYGESPLVQAMTDIAKLELAVKNGGMKFDAGKPQPMLLIGGMPSALEGISAVLAFGAEKYEAHSWRTVPNGMERYSNAMFRHLFKWLRGEELDDESGLHHLDHAATNLLFIRELVAQEKK